MATYKTPGVYVQEISLFPPSVAEVATAIPAFIGYTEIAEYKGNSLTHLPTRITSMLEYRERFGGDPRPGPNGIIIDLDGNNNPVNVTIDYNYLLYNALQTFFGNGGGDCYIVSVGGFDDDIKLDNFKTGLDVLEKYDEPTMIVFPDAVRLSNSELGTLQSLALEQANKLGDRVVILDVQETGELDTDKQTFRSRIGVNNLKYGAAYTPYLHTSLVHEFRFSDLFFNKGGSRKSFDAILKENNDIKKIDDEWKLLADKLGIKIDVTKITEKQKVIEDAVIALLAVVPIPIATALNAADKTALTDILASVQVLSLDTTLSNHVNGIVASAIPKLEADLALDPGVDAQKSDKVQASLTAFSDLMNHLKEGFSTINTASLNFLIKNNANDLKTLVDKIIANDDAVGNRTKYTAKTLKVKAVFDEIKKLNNTTTAKVDVVLGKLTALNGEVPAATPANLQIALDAFIVENDKFLKENSATEDQIKQLQGQIPELSTYNQISELDAALKKLSEGNVSRDRTDINSSLLKIIKKLRVSQNIDTEKQDLLTKIGGLKAQIDKATTSTDSTILTAATALVGGSITQLTTLLAAPNADNLEIQRNAFNAQMKALESALLKVEISIAELDIVLRNVSLLYANSIRAIEQHGIALPPSAAIAGVYTAVDSSRGVWKAPANVSLNYVNTLSVLIDHYAQEDLNVDTNGGKSINAIRSFTGKGTIVWGARTLAGNDNEWRYISVRRFFNMVEESVKKSTEWAVFEPNDSKTWGKVKGMIDNYLYQKWMDGALAGSRPDDAYFVKVGLGLTMSPQDILEGRMIIEIGMAAVRPAEFIILKFSHKLQKS